MDSETPIDPQQLERVLRMMIDTIGKLADGKPVSAGTVKDLRVQLRELITPTER